MNKLKSKVIVQINMIDGGISFNCNCPKNKEFLLCPDCADEIKEKLRQLVIE